MGKSKRSRGLCRQCKFVILHALKMVVFARAFAGRRRGNRHNPMAGAKAAISAGSNPVHIVHHLRTLIWPVISVTMPLQTAAGRGCLQGLDSPDAKEREKAAALLSQLFSSHDEVANHRNTVCLNIVPRCCQLFRTQR